MRSPIRMTLAVALLVLPLLLSSVAIGGGYEEPTRRQWVRQADDICEKPYKRGNKLVDKFSKRADNERWGPAGEILIQLSKIVHGVIERVAELDSPPADTRPINRWLSAEDRGAHLFEEAGRKLKREKVRKAAKLLDKSDRIVTKGQKQVKDFGLRKCI